MRGCHCFRMTWLQRQLWRKPDDVLSFGADTPPKISHNYINDCVTAHSRFIQTITARARLQEWCQADDKVSQNPRSRTDDNRCVEVTAIESRSGPGVRVTYILARSCSFRLLLRHESTF